MAILAIREHVLFYETTLEINHNIHGRSLQALVHSERDLVKRHVAFHPGSSNCVYGDYQKGSGWGLRESRKCNNQTKQWNIWMFLPGAE